MKKIIFVVIFTFIQLSFLVNVPFVQAQDSLEEVEDYLISNPVLNDIDGGLQHGVINPGGVPTVGKFTNDKGQINNEDGVASVQWIIIVVISWFLKLIGAFALFGIIMNAYKLVVFASDESKHEEASGGLMYAIIGLLVVIFTHAIVSALVQVLGGGA